MGEGARNYIVLFGIWIVASLAFGESAAHQHEGPKPGEYLGYIKVDNQESKVPAILSLVIVQPGEEYAHMRGSLKVLLGGFGSTEYYSQFYETVVWSMSRGRLVFDSDEEEITIWNAMAHKMMGALMIMGRFRTANGNATGELKLFHVSPDIDINMMMTKLYPSTRVINTLGGTYRGVCEGTPVMLQLEASKWPWEEGMRSSPLVGYKVRGRWGVRDDRSCGSDGGFCTTDRFHWGSYNFYLGELILEGLPKGRTFRVEADRLIDGDCILTKEKTALFPFSEQPGDREVFPRRFSLELSELEPVPTIPSEEDLEGEYHGYLHHEVLDRYQYLRLNVKAFYFQTIPHQEFLHVSATSAIYFGPAGSREYINAKYNKRRYLDTAPNFVLEGDGDTYIRITRWLKGAILGTLYSRSFGRVGTIELLLDEIPPLPAKAKVFHLIGGYYQGNGWKLHLMVSRNTVQGQSKFYPLSIGGTAAIHALTRNYEIVGGSYDFFTNTLSFEVEDGRMVLGKQADNGDLSLFIPGKPAWAIELGKQELSNYRKMRAE